MKNVRKYKKRLNSYQMSLIWSILDDNYDFKGFSDYKETPGEAFEITKAQATRFLQLKEITIYLQTLLLIHLVKLKEFERVQKYLLYIFSIIIIG